MQVISTLSETYNVPWPQRLLDWFSWLNVINLNMLNIPYVSISCVVETDFYVTWKFYVAGPVVILFTLLGITRLLLVLFRRMHATENDLRHLWDRCIQTMIWVVYVLYPMCCRTCLAILNCREFDPGQW